MRPLLTPQEMGAADEATISGGTPGHELMERAGRAVARTVIRLVGGRYGKRAAVVCGKGNNGGDGFVAARILRQEGLGVRCLFVGDPESVAGDAVLQRDRMTGAGIAVERFEPGRLGDCDVIVDALFGTGFRGQAEGDAARAIATINSSSAVTVSVDIPSGVEGATGRVDGPAVKADASVVMAAEKLGTAVGSGALHAGDVEVVDIGIRVDRAHAWMADTNDVLERLPRRKPDAHKRSAGSVALLCGSEGMSGAAILSARGAVRMGAGYATLGVTEAIEPIVSEVLPEVLTKVLTDEPLLGPDSLDAFKSVLDRADSVAMGPGLGEGDKQRALVTRALTQVEQPLVLDADALNVLAGHTEALQDRSRPVVLTPHPAELARLLERPTEAVQADRVAAAREGAKHLESIVILKGFRSIVADPTGEVVVNPTGSSHLATAGTGDVLTGAIAALLAAGLPAFESAWVATYVHGIAGEVAAALLGGGGVVAWDVAEALPEAIARLRAE